MQRLNVSGANSEQIGKWEKKCWVMIWSCWLIKFHPASSESCKFLTLNKAKNHEIEVVGSGGSAMHIETIIYKIW